MIRKLSSRLDSLESAAASSARLGQDSKEDIERRKKAMCRLAEIVEEARTGIPAWKSLSHAKQVRYWRERMKEAEQMIAGGVEGIRPTPGVAPGIDLAMREMTIKVATREFAEAQEQLARRTAK